MKLKWLISLVILIALTGQVWAGVCGCFGDEGNGHSCCKKDTSGKDSIAAKGCCSADCEAAAGSATKNPQKSNSDNPHLRAPAKAALTPESNYPVWLSNLLRAEAPRPKVRTGDNRLRLARGPDLFLRHNSFLI